MSYESETVIAHGGLPLRARAGRVRWTSERMFYTAMAGLFLLIVFVGYAPSYYLRGVVEPARPLMPMATLVHVHGVLFSLWILLFIVQVGFISGGRKDLHRHVGIVGALLAVVMLVVGTLTGLYGVMRQSGPPGIPPLQWLAIPLFDMPFFGMLVATALVLRKRPQAHKRLMTFTMIGLMAPAVARIPLLDPYRLSVFMPSDLLVLPLVGWDLFSSGRVHLTSIAGTLTLVLWRALPPLVWETEPWLRFAGWAAGLVT